MFCNTTEYGEWNEWGDFLGQDLHLPFEVSQFLGYKVSSPQAVNGELFTELNDRQKLTFSQIADLIEA